MRKSLVKELPAKSGARRFVAISIVELTNKGLSCCYGAELYLLYLSHEARVDPGGIMGQALDKCKARCDDALRRLNYSSSPAKTKILSQRNKE